MTIDVISPENGQPQRLPITLEGNTPCSLCLAVVAGADAVEVVLREDDRVVSAIEVPTLPGQDITVEIWRDSAGMVHCMPRKRQFLLLPDEEPPEPPVLVPPAGDELYLAILVDGTCLHSSETARTLEYLLSPSLAQEWGGVATQLAEFASIVSKNYSDIWITSMAFGDEPMPMIASNLLQPRYLIHPLNPDERQFRPTTSAKISDHLSGLLRKLPYTPGGDFVDGLADGLRAVGQLLWSGNSRKLLLIFGQSPGYSLFEPAEPLTNLLARTVCVEEEIDLLHKKGIEVITIFHRPDEADERYQNSSPQSFISHSQRQYESLASLPSWTAISPAIDVNTLASSWLKPPKTIARGSCPGRLIPS